MVKKTQAIQQSISDIDNIDPLLFEYKTNPTEDIYNEIIKKYYYLIKVVSSRVKVIGFDKNDIESYASFGLIDAIEKFNISKNVKFEYYAKKRIHGSIYDFIRKEGTCSRATINNYRLYVSFIENFNIEHNRAPNHNELIEYFGKLFMDKIKISNNQLIVKMTDELSNVLYYENDFIKNLDDEQKNKLFDKILDKFTDKELVIFFLLYCEDYSIMDISDIFNLTQARICQFNSVIKKKITKWINLCLV